MMTVGRLYPTSKDLCSGSQNDLEIPAKNLHPDDGCNGVNPRVGGAVCPADVRPGGNETEDSSCDRLGSHYYLQFGADSALYLARFERHLNGNLARKMGKLYGRRDRYCLRLVGRAGIVRGGLAGRAREDSLRGG